MAGPRIRWARRRAVAGLVGLATALGGAGMAGAAGPPAQPATPVPGGGTEEDHAALRQFKALFEQAVNENRIDLMRPYLAEPFSVVTYTDREFTDFAAFTARWQETRNELLQGGRYTLTLEPDRSEIFGDVAVAHGNSDNVMVTGSGDHYRFPSHWTVVFRKVDGQWKIARAHSSLSPFDNPMLRAGVRRLVLRSAAGALLAGLALGWLAATLLARRRARRRAPAAP